MNLRKLALTLGSTALVAAAATPALAQQSSTTPSDPASTTGTTGTTGAQTGHARGHRGHRGGRLTDAQLTTVATKLGVTLEQLKAAQVKVKTAIAATDARETSSQKDALLAAELGVTAAQVKAAFASVRSAAGTRRGRGDCPKGGGSSTGTTGTTGATSTAPSDV